MYLLSLNMFLAEKNLVAAQMNAEYKNAFQ